MPAPSRYLDQYQAAVQYWIHLEQEDRVCVPYKIFIAISFLKEFIPLDLCRFPGTVVYGYHRVSSPRPKLCGMPR